MSGLAKRPWEGFMRKWRVTFISKSSRRSTLKAFKCSLTTELVNGRPVEGQQMESPRPLQVNKGLLLQPVPPPIPSKDTRKPCLR